MKKLIMFLPSVNRGGNEKNFFSAANQINSKKIKVLIISCDKYKIQKKLNFKNDIKLINFVKFSLKFKYLISFFLLIFNNKQKHPILSFQGNVVAIIAAKLIGCKVFVRFNSTPDNFLKSNFKTILFKYFYKKADGIFVNSNEMKLSLKEKLGLDSKLVYNDLDIRSIKFLSKKKLKFKKFKNYHLKKLIIVGRLDKNKNHSLLIKALNKIKKKFKFNLLILGSGPEKKKLQKLINKFILKDYVKIIDYKKNPYPYIRFCDYLVLSSLYEGYPNVLIEAGCLNKLVISSDCKTGPKEIIKSDRNGFLFKSNNLASLTTLLEKISKNKIIHKQKINNLKKYIFNFHKKDNSKEYLKHIFIK